MYRNFKHSSEYLPMYHKLPINKKALGAELLGFKSCSGLLKSKHASRYNYNKFVEFYNHVTKDKQSKNTIGTPVEFDNEQKKHYLTKLNEWIDSDEYSLATMKVRNVIIAEQKRISKQIKD